MRPHSFDPRMPQGRPFHHSPGPMQQFNQFPPRQMPHGRMPHGMMPNGFPSPQGDPSKTGSFMDTASRFLSTAQNFQPLIQQAAPLIQQATPMIKNLPALWKLYKGFQSAPETKNNEYIDSSSFGEQSFGHYEKSRKDEFHESPRRSRSRSSHRDKEERTSSKKGPSVPRIFQPPYDFD